MKFDIDTLQSMLIEHAKTVLGDKLDLVFIYGSSLTNKRHRYSDFDISFVPSDTNVWDGGITVILDGIMLDFYPIHWSRLEAMSCMDVMGGTILYNSSLVYSRNEESKVKFDNLRSGLERNLSFDKRKDMIYKSMAQLKSASYQHFLISCSKGNSLECMFHAKNLVNELLLSLSQLNQQCIDTRKRDQINSLKLVPKDFMKLIDQLLYETGQENIEDLSFNLLNMTRELLVSEQRKLKNNAKDIKEALNEGYPEFKGDLQRTEIACEREDLLSSAYLLCIHEFMIHLAPAVEGVEYNEFNAMSDYFMDLAVEGFPDLVPYVQKKDFNGLKKGLMEFDQALRVFHRKHEIPLYEYGSLEDLDKFIKSREIVISITGGLSRRLFHEAVFLQLN